MKQKIIFLIVGLVLAACIARAGLPDVPISVQTASTGTNYASFSSQACTSVSILNTTGTDLQIKMKNSATPIPLPNATVINRLGVQFNANEVSVRRTDTSNTQVTVTAIAIH